MKPFLTLFTYPSTCTMQGDVFTSKDKQLQLVAVGAIYNYPELRAMLEAKGYAFVGHENAEVILHLYEEYGVECLQYLRGPFAFALYDKQKNQLQVARDRIGEKTLYYAHTAKGIAISTSLKEILENTMPASQVNVERLLEPLRFTAPIHSYETFIEGINRVQPGEYLLIGDKGLQREQYWKRERTYSFAGSYAQAKEETLHRMQEAVDLCMRSDEPVAVMLSGGVDSSAMAALAKRAGHEVHSITAGYAGQHACDERDVARRFAKEQGFDHREIEMQPEDYRNSFEELTEVLDEPITDSAAIAQWALFKKVRELGYKVLIGGMGGDELFYGYPVWNSLSESLRIRREHESIFPWKGADKKEHFLRFVMRHWQHILYAGYPSKLEDHSWGWWIHDDYYRFTKDATVHVNGKDIRLDDYTIWKGFAPCTLGKEIDLIYDDAFDKVMTMAYLFVSDRLGSGLDLEIRSPLLDYQFVEHAMQLPLEIKYHAGKPKQYMKDVLAGIVPDYILYAQKRGFTPPNTFVQDVTEQHPYKHFTSQYPFYNAVLADTILTKLGL